MNGKMPGPAQRMFRFALLHSSSANAFCASYPGATRKD